MIEFKIIACPDRSQQSTYQHLGKDLTIGQSEGDMIVDDPTIAPLQLRISRQGTAYVLENLSEDVEVRLNGKPIHGQAPIKERDNLNVGRTVINFTRLDAQPLQPPPPYEYPHAATRLAPGTREKAILDALQAQAEKELGPAPGGMKPPVPGAAATSPPPLPGGVKPPPPPGVKPPLPPRKN